ncbi:ClpXP protease specificity-enhancing factor SspB [Ghiorsea bivora]|uniref:ClpXP protease specificity-enhancing factor SspB n=1 Tax=Ghiorsea bivora TaxID=1485545 RepID=UPI00056F83A9|nr:ClpXP protease specificity-enhancing factor SspB [Ghiorsea bivora]
MSVNFEDALKAKKLRDFFYEHKRIFILVDAAADDVQLPEHLKHDHALPLVLNARMPQPIHIRDSSLESKFSFSGVSQHCVIPMKRIWAVYLPEQDLSSGILWEDDMPESIKTQVQQEVNMSEEEMQTLTDATVEKSSAAAGETKASDVGRKVRHLRVVK